MKMILAGIGVALLCAGISTAALRDSGAVYHGCVGQGSGLLRVADTCRQDERAISWNQVGPQGLQGPQGETGPQGPKGDAGPQGPAGAVSLASLDGSACTRADGSASTVSVMVGNDESIALSCGASGVADWCSTNTPTAGPHMSVSCDSGTHRLTYACDPAWMDLDGDTSNGCEVATPLAPIAFDGFSLSGLEELSANPGGVSSTDVAPQCDGGYDAGCPGGTPSTPRPTLTIDLTKQASDDARAVFVADRASSLFNVTFRARVETVTPIPVTLPVGGQCALGIDTTKGARADVALSFVDTVDTVDAPDGPTVPGAVALAGFESSDYSLSGGFACGVASISLSDLAGIVQRALTPWAQTKGQICGAPSPWYYQWCPNGVPRGL